MNKVMMPPSMTEEVRREAMRLTALGKTRRYRGTNFVANIPNLVKAMCQRGAANCGVPSYWRELYPADLLGDI